MNFRRAAVSALVLSAALLALAGCSKSTSVTAPTTLNNTPPAAPENLVGLFDVAQARDYLIWSPSSSANVASYEVWRYDGDPTLGNTGTLLGTVSASSNFLLLPRPTQNTIEYLRARSRAVDGTPSAFSASIRLQRHGATSAPEGLPAPEADPTPVKG